MVLGRHEKLDEAVSTKAAQVRTPLLPCAGSLFCLRLHPVVTVRSRAIQRAAIRLIPTHQTNGWPYDLSRVLREVRGFCAFARRLLCLLGAFT